MSNKKRLFSYLKREKIRLVFIFILSLIFVVSQLCQPFLLGKGLDYAKDNDSNAFYICLIIALSGVVLGVITSYFFEVEVGILSQRVIKAMRDDIYQKMLNVPLEEFDKKKHGDLLQLEIRDMENMASGLYAFFKSLVQGIFSIIITILMMFMVNWILALLVIVLTPLSVLMSSFVARFNHKYFKKQASLQSELNSVSLETLNNIDIVQSFNNENRSIDKFEEINQRLKKEGRIAQFSASWINPSTRLVNNTIYTIIGVIGIVMLAYDSDLALVFAVMSIGRLSSFLSYTTQYSKPFNEVSGVISEYEAAKYSFRRINEFLNLNDDIDEGKEEVDDISSLAFNHLSFSYQENQKLIEDFSLEIKKGNKIAIVGPTGAGKTTLINLIMRFYEPNKGELLLNNKPLVDYSKSSYRNKIGMVLQDTWIFKGTVLDNIRYIKEDASLEEVKEAARKAHADSFIDNLPKGYMTLISSKEGLSEGQKQMIAIARVMLLNPDVVILDEATSNIDTRSEKLIGDAFDKMMEDKTSIVIAHRLSTIVEADTIIVIKDGAIVETGNHKELMKKEGFYYSLYSSQFK